MTEDEQRAREEASKAATAREELEARVRRGTAYRMMETAWSGQTRTAWTDINSMLHGLLWFIVTRIRPSMHELEISLIYRDFRGGHWFGEDGEESLYRCAIQEGHDTAPASVEKFLRREPFWIEEDGEKRRLFVGRIFRHQGELLRVTSFFDQGVRCVRDGKDVKAGVVEVLRAGLEAEREAMRRKRLDEAKRLREAMRADPVPFVPLRLHLTSELQRLGEARHRGGIHIPENYLAFADEHGSDYRAAYNAIPCAHALTWYLRAIGMREGRHVPMDADQCRKNYPWSKVEQHLFRELRGLRGLPLRDEPEKETTP